MLLISTNASIIKRPKKIEAIRQEYSSSCAIYLKSTHNPNEWCGMCRWMWYQCTLLFSLATRNQKRKAARKKTSSRERNKQTNKQKNRHTHIFMINRWYITAQHYIFWLVGHAWMCCGVAITSSFTAIVSVYNEFLICRLRVRLTLSLNKLLKC